MHFLGYRDARLTVVGPDEGVDVRSARALAQVKAGESPTGRPVVQQLFGVSALYGSDAILFSVAPITEDAREWADRARVSLFRLDLAGGLAPVNAAAREMFARAEGQVVGWEAVIAELETLAHERREATIHAKFDLEGGHRGVWSLRVDAGGRFLMSRDFAGSGERRVASAAEGVDLIAASLRQMGGRYEDCVVWLRAAGGERPFRPRIHYPEVPDPPVAADVDRAGQPRRITASDVYALLAAPGCERRFALDERGLPRAEPSLLHEMLMGLGVELERQHLQGLGDVLDASAGSLEQRVEDTWRALRTRHGAIYQGVLNVELEVDGRPWSIVGAPDFLLAEDDGHVVRDVKTARSVSEEERPDLAGQLRLYGWLYERTMGTPPRRLEVVAGDGLVHVVAPAGDDEIEEILERIARLKTIEVDPYCAVKPSDKMECPFFDHCWREAVGRSDPCIVPGVSKAIAKQLRMAGVGSVDELLRAHTAETLGAIRVSHGARTRRVGAQAERILRGARSLLTGEIIAHAPLGLPEASSWVLFDLEGMPSLGPDDGYIYLWGTSMEGERAMPYHAAFAEIDPLDEEAGWKAFLRRCEEVFDLAGPDVPFLHWSAYERTHVDRCLAAHGDLHGVAIGVRSNLVDLLQHVRKGLTLPVHSYGLKTIEKYVGFERTQDLYGGDWSIKVWGEVLESESPSERRRLLDELATYNREDLEAMSAVFSWLKEIGD